MNRRLIATMLTAACAVLPATVPAGPAYAQTAMKPSMDIVLSVGRGQLISVPGNMADVFVANEAVADVQVKSQRQLYVFGLAGGETTVYASNAAGDIVWAANIRVGSNIDSIDQMMALAMPDAKVSVATMGNNTVLLTGTVAAPEDAAEAERLVKAYLGESSNVISRLKTATPLQVNLQVKFAEVSRSLVRTLGMNMMAADSTSGFKFGIGQGRAITDVWTPGGPTLGVGNGLQSDADTGANAITSVSPGTTLGAAGKLLGLDLLGALDLAETNGLVTTLSQPNLTALSGETAEFLAGGEFPIPMSQGLGSTSVEYKKYGVSLSYTPTVLANGRISMRVRPEVSELSSQGAVTLNNFTIPALTVRRAETTIELGSGQSFMIAGLLSNNAQNAISKAPGLGDLPVLGNLFKSTEFRKGQTELVIVVTPYLVKPVDANDIKLPTDGFRASSTLNQLFTNQENDGVTGGDRPKPTAVGEGASAPKIGIEDTDDQSRPKSAKRDDRRAEADPVPGFSLK